MTNGPGFRQGVRLVVLARSGVVDHSKLFSLFSNCEALAIVVVDNVI